MAYTTSNLGLHVWNLLTDHFNHSELESNWTAIDAHDHTSGKGLQIPTGGIAANAVTNAKLANDAADSRVIATGAVGTTEIADGAVTTAKIADTSITTAKVVDGAITSAKIADGTIATADIAAAQVTKAKLATDALNTFLKLANAGDVSIKFGVSATGSFGGNPQIQWTIAHGLGRTPTVAFVTGGGIATFSSGGGQVPIVGSVNTLDGTSLGAIWRTSDNASTNNSTPVYWCVIG